MSNKCEHERIIVSSMSKNDNNTFFEVSCDNCEEVIYNGEHLKEECFNVKEMSLINFLIKNRERFNVLIDHTRIDLNKKCNIKSDIEQINLINLLEYLNEEMSKLPEDNIRKYHITMSKRFLKTLKNHGETKSDLVFVEKSWIE